MQTAAARVHQDQDTCEMRLDGAVTPLMIADLRRLSAQARHIRLDLRTALVSPPGALALLAWQQSNGDRLELLLPKATTFLQPAELRGTADTAPVDLPDLLTHELRGPLAVAHLRLQTLRAHLAASGLAEEANACEDSLACLRAVDRLLDTYLTASRPWQTVPVDLAAICQVAMQAVSARYPEARITLHRAPPDTPLLVGGEPQALQQVIWNLLRNSVEAGGEVAIELSLVAGAPLLCVRDTGPGFPPTVLASPAQRLPSAKPGGMGIGLLLCRWIAQRHGGQLSLANASAGAVVTVQFPPLSGPG